MILIFKLHNQFLYCQLHASYIYYEVYTGVKTEKQMLCLLNQRGAFSATLSLEEWGTHGPERSRQR